MMTAREIATWDAQRSAFLNQYAQRCRANASSREDNTDGGGKLTATLPKNWPEIRTTIEANIDVTLATTERDREAVIACVGFAIGITQRALAVGLGIKRGNAGVHVSRQRRGRCKWLITETERIAKLCPKPVFVEEGKSC